MRRKAKTTRKLASLQKTILSAAGIVLLAFVLYVVHDASKPSLKEQTLIKQRYEIPVNDFPSVGPADAPVVIVEFSDFQCEYCALFSKETFPTLIDKYTGKVRFVFRSSPSGSDLSTSFQSAQAALCANDQNAYLEYHDAFSALVFHYRQVLGMDLPWLQEIGRPRAPHRLPMVMSRAEAATLLQATTGQHQPLFRLLYGAGM